MASGYTRISGLLTALAVAGAGLAHAADMKLTVTSRGFPIVEVALNGEGPFPMVLDTGAGLTTVTTGVRDELNLVNMGRMPHPVQVAGGSETVDLYMLGFVELGGERAPAPITIILDAPMRYVREARGILGMNVLSRFALDLDQPNRRVILRAPGELPREGEGWTALKTDARADYFLIVDADLGDGVTAKAVIDTGANETILNAALAEALGVVEGAPGVSAGGIRLVGAKSLKAKLKQVDLGGVRWTGLGVQAADLPLFKALELDDRPALILGNDALKQVRLFVDYKGGRIFLTRPPAPALIGESGRPELHP